MGKRIKDLATAKFKGFMALDDTDGTGKFNIENLFKSIAQVFDPTREESNSYKKDEAVMYQGELYVFTAAHYGGWTGTDAVKIDLQKLITPLVEKLSTTEFIKIPGQEDVEEIKILTDENEVVLLLQKDKLQVKSVEAFNGTAFEKLWPGGIRGRRTIDSDSIVITDENYNFVASLDKDGVHAKEYFIRETLGGDDEPLDVEESVEIVLPAKFTAVVDDTLQLFYRGIIKHPNPYIWALNFNCSVGKNTPRFYEVTPAAGDVGNKTLTMLVKTKDNKVVGTASTTLKIIAKPSSPGSVKKILCFGDSLTSGGVWCAEAYRRLTGSGGTPEGLGLTNIEFCGRMTKDGAGYFGIGGWSWTDYTTAGRRAIRFQVTGVGTLSYGAVYTNNGHNYTIIENNTTEGTGNILCSVDYGSSYVPDSTMTLTKSSGSGDATITYTSYSEDSQNPLWDYSENKMTFVPYANEVSNGQIDVVYTLLTWNSLTGYKTNFTDIMAKVKTFADTLHAEFPNAKFKLMGLQMPSVNGGIGANYGASGNYYDWFGMVVTAMNMEKAYREFAESAGYSDFVEFVNVAAEFDSEWNMPRIEAKVNTRSSQTEIRGTNGVHPGAAGQEQIGDVVYRNLCEFLQ